MCLYSKYITFYITITNKFINFFRNMFNTKTIKINNFVSLSKFSTVSTCSSLISKLHLVNGAQFFKANLELASAASALIGPLIKIYASA